MLKTKHNIVAIGILGVALAIVIVVVGGISWHRVPATPGQTAQNTTSTSGTSGAASSTSAPRVYTPHPPHGSVTYQIAEAATQLPSFVQATIDPADVAVGQVQHFVIVTSDPNPIVSVVATITTDHKTITVPLVSQGAPATSMLVPRTITVGADNKLALIAPGTNAAGDLAAADTEQGTHIANAATANDTEFTGQWTVEDTHSAKYNTVFTAKDSAGNENSVTLEWTDPCAFSTVNNYGGGTATVSGNCSISGIDGPELGNLLVSSGATLTLGSGATLVINSGYNISFSSGAIAIPSGAQILFGKDMCGTDNDGDGYIGGSSWTICGTGVTRANISGATADCNDGDARAYPGAGFQTTQEVGTPGPGGVWDFNCDGVVTEYYTAVSNGCDDGSKATCNADRGWLSGDPGCGNTAYGRTCGWVNANSICTVGGTPSQTQSCD